MELTEVAYIGALEEESSMTKHEQRRLVRHRLAILRPPLDLTAGVEVECLECGIGVLRRAAVEFENLLT
jgi:hypothetical protein